MDKKGDIVGEAVQTLSPTNENGYIDYDPLEIIYSVRSCFNKLFQKHKLTKNDVEAISIVSSSYAVLGWNKGSSMALSRAISTKCKRSLLCKSLLKTNGQGDIVFEKTGLHAQDSSRLSLMNWLSHHNADIKSAHKNRELALAPVESWVLWNLTGLKQYDIDDTNASQTMFYNIYDGCWDDFICRDFGIDSSVLPTVKPADTVFGTTNGFLPIPDGIPICGMLHRIHSRLLSSIDTQYRTAHVFLNSQKFSLLVNIGQDRTTAHPDLKTMIVPTSSQIRFALDAVIDFPQLPTLMSNTKFEDISPDIFDSLSQSESLLVFPSKTKQNKDGVPLIHLFNIANETTEDMLFRAYYKSLVFQIKQFISHFEQLTEISLKEITISGRLSRNEQLRQFLSDILQLPVKRLYESHTYLRGLFFLTAKKTGFLTESQLNKKSVFKQHVPNMDPISSYALYNQWLQVFDKI
jgi:glycerol kinase